MTNSSASYKPQKEVLIQNIGKHLYIVTPHSLTHSLRNLTCKTFLISSSPLFRENTFQNTGGAPQVTYKLPLQHCMYYYEQILFTHTCTDTQIIFQNIYHLYWSNCPIRKQVHWSCCEEIQIKCTDSIYHPAAQLQLLCNCCPAKDGNPKVLRHDCGIRWKSKCWVTIVMDVATHLSYWCGHSGHVACCMAMKDKNAMAAPSWPLLRCTLSHSVWCRNKQYWRSHLCGGFQQQNTSGIPGDWGHNSEQNSLFWTSLLEGCSCFCIMEYISVSSVHRCNQVSSKVIIWTTNAPLVESSHQTQ